MTQEHVVLVDEQDKTLGTMEKIRAHELGLLHRAFSVFVYRSVSPYRGSSNSSSSNSRKLPQLEFLLQQRQADKYHCGNLWTNTCCSHPRLHETVLEAGQRRLKEEMSLDIRLESAGSFIYRSEFSNGLTEHEFDHVLIGEYQESMTIVVDPTEVQNFAWVTIEELQHVLEHQPHLYTPWFKPALNIALDIAMERLCHSCHNY